MRSAIEGALSRGPASAAAGPVGLPSRDKRCRHHRGRRRRSWAAAAGLAGCTWPPVVTDTVAAASGDKHAMPQTEYLPVAESARHSLLDVVNTLQRQACAWGTASITCQQSSHEQERHAQGRNIRQRAVQARQEMHNSCRHFLYRAVEVRGWTASGVRLHQAKSSPAVPAHWLTGARRRRATAPAPAARRVPWTGWPNTPPPPQVTPAGRSGTAPASRAGHGPRSSASCRRRCSRVAAPPQPPPASCSPPRHSEHLHMGFCTIRISVRESWMTSDRRGSRRVAEMQVLASCCCW